MEIIKATALQGCIVGIILSVISSVIPEKNFTSQLKMIYSAFFLISFLAPLKNSLPGLVSDFSSDICTEDYYEMENASKEEMKILIRKNTEQALREKFTEMGMAFDELEAEINIGDDYKAELVSVKVKTSNRKAAESVLKTELGDSVRILFADDEEP